MRSLISLLFVVLVVFALSKLLIRSGPVNPHQGDQPRSQSGSSTSDFVRDSVNQSTKSYQQELEQSMEKAGASGEGAQ